MMEPPHCVAYLVVISPYSCSWSTFIMLPSMLTLFFPCLVLCSSQFIVDVCPCEGVIVSPCLHLPFSVDMPVSAISATVFVLVITHLIITLYTILALYTALALYTVQALYTLQALYWLFILY